MRVLAFLLMAAVAGAGPPSGYSKLLRSYRGGDVEGSIRRNRVALTERDSSARA